MIKAIIILFFQTTAAIPKLATCPGQVQQITDTLILYYIFTSV